MSYVNENILTNIGVPFDFNKTIQSLVKVRISIILPQDLAHITISIFPRNSRCHSFFFIQNPRSEST